MTLDEIKTIIPSAISVEPIEILPALFGFNEVVGFKVFYTGKAPQWKTFKVGENRYKWHFDPVPVNAEIKERIYKPQKFTYSNGVTTRF
jgi:hypothetical protein